MSQQPGTLEELPEEDRQAMAEAASPWSTGKSCRCRRAIWCSSPAAPDYVNPETGTDVLPTMGFTAMYLPAGQRAAPPLRSASAAVHMVRGSGRSTINGKAIAWGPEDTFTAPVSADIPHDAAEDAFLVRVRDRPPKHKLGYCEERAR